MADKYARILPLRYIFEPVQGLSAARNRALQEFVGSLLIFTDDDVVLDPNWLSAYLRAERDFPNASYFGGRILPRWDRGKPRWLIDPNLTLVSGLIGHFDLGEQVRWFQRGDPCPFGASFGLRRGLVEKLEPFRLDLGVKGGSVGRGEEAEYLDRAMRLGNKGVYVGTAVCHHAQDPKRFQLGYLYRFGIEKGRAQLAINGPFPVSRLNQAGFFVRGIWQWIKGRPDRFRQCVINIGIQQAGLEYANARKILRRGSFE